MSSKNKGSNSITNMEKVNKNNYYLKQQMAQGKKPRGASHDAHLHRDPNAGPGTSNGPSMQHRKNHSVVI